MPNNNQIELEFGNVGFWGEEKTGVPGEKPLGSSKEENQQQTQPTYDAGSGNRTQDKLVWGVRSHHYALPASPACTYFPQAQYNLILRAFSLAKGWGVGVGKVAQAKPDSETEMFLSLKGRSQLWRIIMRIRYQFIANLHVTDSISTVFNQIW